MPSRAPSHINAQLREQLKSGGYNGKLRSNVSDKTLRTMVKMLNQKAPVNPQTGEKEQLIYADSSERADLKAGGGAGQPAGEMPGPAHGEQGLPDSYMRRTPQSGRRGDDQMRSPTTTTTVPLNAGGGNRLLAADAPPYQNVAELQAALDAATEALAQAHAETAATAAAAEAQTSLMGDVVGAATQAAGKAAGAAAGSAATTALGIGPQFGAYIGAAVGGRAAAVAGSVANTFGARLGGLASPGQDAMIPRTATGAGTPHIPGGGSEETIRQARLRAVVSPIPFQLPPDIPSPPSDAGPPPLPPPTTDGPPPLPPPMAEGGYPSPPPSANVGLMRTPPPPPPGGGGDSEEVLEEKGDEPDGGQGSYGGFLAGPGGGAPGATHGIPQQPQPGGQLVGSPAGGGVAPPPPPPAGARAIGNDQFDPGKGALPRGPPARGGADLPPERDAIGGESAPPPLARASLRRMRRLPHRNGGRCRDGFCSNGGLATARGEGRHCRRYCWRCGASSPSCWRSRSLCWRSRSLCVQ